MKRLITFFLAAIILLSLVGCSDVSKADSGLDSSEYTSNDFYVSRNIYVRTQFSSYGNVSTIWFYIANYSSDEMTYTGEYILEKYVGNDSWRAVPFTAGIRLSTAESILPSNLTAGFRLDFSDFDYEFTDGKYRIIKKIGEKLCCTEFTIDRTSSNVTLSTPYGYSDMSTLPATFTVKNAIDSETAAITSGNNYHTDRISEFAVFSTTGIPSMVRIARYGEENALTITDLVYDGNTYTWTYDNTRDPNTETPGTVTETRGYMITDGIDIYLSDYPSWAESSEAGGTSNILILSKAETTVAKDISSLLLILNYNAENENSEEPTE